ncbi:Nucleic acid-binding OB-fold [Arabidopsis suecica]|uniref:Nucleic acid-binding OB-fold n=1 Tax=Arabidopsis suecica TaxID=45249 RepID=A0A8T1XQY7_ARASU|nr:Nucleic acid-binding OB-fold [Arabidopsis suecica]
MASFNSVSDLKPFKNMWKIKVKIIRLWKSYSAKNGESIEMILIDDKGDKIQATIKSALVDQFRSRLEEGESRIFINFSLFHSTGMYRTTKHPYRIGFLDHTRVRRCDKPLPDGLNGFSPVKFDEILDATLDDNYLVDVIGQMINVTQVEDVPVNGKDTKKVTVELRNEIGDRLSVVLWGEYAEYVNNSVQAAPGTIVICAIKFGKIKVWKDNRSLSNAYNCSVVILNPDFPGVEEFMSLLPKDNLTLAIVNSNPFAIVGGVSDKEDFFVHTPRRTITEVKSSREVSKCIVMATILAIDGDMAWYYWSCKICSKKVIPVPVEDFDDGESGDILPLTFHCPKCKIDNPVLVPRFKLHIRVTDNTGNTNFLLFDNLAQQIIGHTATELAPQEHNEIQESDLIPGAVVNVVGKTFLFKIGIEKEHIVYKHDTYKVLKIITDLEMITEFSDKDSQQDTVDTIGCIDCNSSVSAPTEAPLMLTESEGPSETSISPDSNQSKRKGSTPLEQIDLPDQTSTTKKLCSAKVKIEKVEKMKNVTKENDPPPQYQPLYQIQPIPRTNDLHSQSNGLQDITNTKMQYYNQARIHRRERMSGKRKSPEAIAVENRSHVQSNTTNNAPHPSVNTQETVNLGSPVSFTQISTLNTPSQQPTSQHSKEKEKDSGFSNCTNPFSQKPNTISSKGKEKVNEPQLYDSDSSGEREPLFDCTDSEEEYHMEDAELEDADQEEEEHDIASSSAREDYTKAIANYFANVFGRLSKRNESSKHESHTLMMETQFMNASYVERFKTFISYSADIEMEDLELPHRLIAAGEAPLGEKANVYNKMKTLRGIIDSLDEDEIKLITDTSLGGLLDFPNKQVNKIVTHYFIN